MEGSCTSTSCLLASAVCGPFLIYFLWILLMSWSVLFFTRKQWIWNFSLNSLINIGSMSSLLSSCCKASDLSVLRNISHKFILQNTFLCISPLQEISVLLLLETSSLVDKRRKVKGLSFIGLQLWHQTVCPLSHAGREMTWIVFHRMVWLFCL